VFRSNAPTSSLALATYETTYDYFGKLSCICYYLGCRVVYEILLGTFGFLRPIHVAVLAAAVLVFLAGFRNVLRLPVVVTNDNTIDKYRPPSTLTFHSGIYAARALV